MQTDQPHAASQQPESAADVPRELHQENIAKTGTPRTADDAGPQPDSHFGAVEDDASGQSDQMAVTPPMAEGPYGVTEGENKQDRDVDPQTEIAGG
ncbi:hypothetical protein [Kallotenue papyrolyticum]|uniref:hypothetical protein n=1 Tax=Kallotenue papyrolyticum TaxID=1325125 RepID=UPI000492B53A|nr:hypothetical protein [Kallotenue papyrolyticum]